MAPGRRRKASTRKQNVRASESANDWNKTSKPAEDTWERVCAEPLFQFLKHGEGREILELFADTKISLGKAAQSITEKFCLGIDPILPEHEVLHDVELHCAQQLETRLEELNCAAAIGPDGFVDWLIRHHGLPESSRTIVRNNLRQMLPAWQ